MKTAAIFDLDGTLVSSVGLHEKAWSALFQKYGITLTEAELKEQSGKKNTTFIDMILQRRGRTDLDAQVLSDEKDATVMDILQSEPSTIHEGVKEFLKLLHEKGIKVVLATSATSQTALMLGKALMDRFDAGVFAEDVQRGKPDPEIFLTAATKVGLAARDCIVFEDAASGVAAAKAGGFFCIAFDGGLGQDLNGADVVIRKYDPEALIKYFER